MLDPVLPNIVYVVQHLGVVQVHNDWLREVQEALQVGPHATPPPPPTLLDISELAQSVTPPPPRDKAYFKGSPPAAPPRA